MKRTLILIAVTFSFGVIGLSITDSSAAETKNDLAFPQATPEKPLSEDQVAELIGELQARLLNFVKDDDAMRAITGKWDAHEDLAGKTKAEVLKQLFADVQTVVTDKKIQENIWASFQKSEEGEEKAPVAAAAKPPPPPHRVPDEVSPDRVNFILVGLETFKERKENPGGSGDHFRVLRAFNPTPGKNPRHDCEQEYGAGNCVLVRGYYAQDVGGGVIDYVDRYVRRCPDGLLYFGYGGIEREALCGFPETSSAKPPAKSAPGETRAIRPIGAWGGIMEWEEKVRITEFFEPAVVCSDADMKVRPGSRFAVGGPCFRNMREAIPSNNSPAYYCEKVHGKGNCVLIKDTIIVGLGADHQDREMVIKKCPSGFKYYSENIQFNVNSNGNGNWEYRLFCVRSK